MARVKTSRPNDSTDKQVITMPDTSSASQVRKSVSPNNPTPIDLEAQIRQRAYELYQERGGGSGHENEDWVRAEREVLARYRHQQSA
jgi:hypothetical protein